MQPPPLPEEHDWVLYIAMVAVVSLLIALLALPSMKKGRGVLIIGAEDAGKTVLWMRLQDGLAANVGMVAGTVFFKDEIFPIMATRKDGSLPPPEVVNVIDTPPDADAMHQIMGKITRTAVVICVVDKDDAVDSCKLAAEQLYSLFTADVMRKERVPVLIACNKSDVGATPASELRALLEAELERIQQERTVAAKDMVVEGKTLGPEVTMINNDGAPFTFDKAPSRVVEFVDCSALHAQTEDLVEFLCLHVPQLANPGTAEGKKAKAE
ncbi:signal recognition particle receptor beta subunit-domain-containing protein [Pavlovales sp. CCMP2436]|nr:signal recognition particle receptor beta subunit-domain-containing protein [Pavlovales sp. CCMP2436]|mmetsp:Transcript_22546/g.57221  ORF Transcript_22546/g.57221 Transcript_22546/m.57221 type:complete len:268 (+) Transcript_22546:97-900(+)